MKYVVELSKGKKIFVPAAGKNKAYYRFDPRDKKLGQPIATGTEAKKPKTMQMNLMEGLYDGLAEGITEALKGVEGIDEKAVKEAVEKVREDVLGQLGKKIKEMQETHEEESEPKIVFGGKVVNEPKGYAKEYQERKSKEVLKSAEGEVFGLLEKDTSPPDEKIHTLAEKMKVNPDALESKIYAILGDIIEHGKGGPSPNLKELKAGIKVESEHTKYPELARYIALAHLKEIPDYYARLKKMEDEAKKGKKD